MCLVTVQLQFLSSSSPALETPGNSFSRENTGLFQWKRLYPDYDLRINNLKSTPYDKNRATMSLSMNVPLCSTLRQADMHGPSVTFPTAKEKALVITLTLKALVITLTLRVSCKISKPIPQPNTHHTPLNCSRVARGPSKKTLPYQHRTRVHIL